MTVLRGSTRNTLLLGPIAIKVPSWSSWSQFIEGVQRNQREDKFANHRDCPCPSVLCPVLAILPGGLANLMPRARALTPEEWYPVYRRLPTFLRRMTGEKQESFGKLPNGQTVAVTFGAPPAP